MYQEVFNFSSQPFTFAPCVNNYVAVGPVKESLDQVESAIARDAGPAVVVGQHGTGKSLLLSLLADQYQERFKVVSLACGPMSQRRDLLQAILFELDQPYRDMTEGELRLSLIDYIKPQEKCPNGLLLLVDDAQELTVDLVDELRLVTNFVRDGVPRVRLVMAGTNRLEEVLTDPKLEPFNQRISARCFLNNLNRDQTRAYVWEHISRVGGNAEMVFEQTTTDAIHETTCGCPRFVNQLAEQSLINAANHGMLVVEPGVIQPAWAQVQGLPVDEPAVSEASIATSEDEEEWTVIEFGSLDEDDAEEEAGTDVEVAEIDEPESGLGQGADEVALDLADGVATERLTDTHEANTDAAAFDEDAQWEAPDTEDPHVEPSEIAGQTQDEAHSEDTFDDAYSYQALVFEPDGDSETENELDSITHQPIPTEIETLYDDQQDTWAATGQNTEPPGIDPEVQDFTEPQMEDSEFAAEPIQEPFIEAAVNPFDEAFESEEHISEGFNGFVAEQNASSLDVTGDELEYLQPVEQDETYLATASGEVSPLYAVAESEDPVDVLEAASDTSDQIEVSEDDQPAEAPAAEYSASELVGAFGALADLSADEQSQPTHLEPLPVEVEATQDELVVDLALESQHATEPFATEIKDSLTVEHLPETEVAPSEAYDQLADVIASPDEETEAKVADSQDDCDDQVMVQEIPVTPSYGQLPMTENPVSEAPEAVVDYPPTSPLAGSFHEHKTHDPTPDIRQRADEILKSIQLSLPDAVSETNSDVPHETESSIAAQLDESQVDTAAQIVDESNTELTEAQQILNEILEQKSLLGAQMQQPLSGDPMSTQESPASETFAMVHPLSEVASADETDDDSDMIVISSITDQQDAETLSPLPESADASSTISTGRAERLDYERLFEQLRNTGNRD